LPVMSTSTLLGVLMIAMAGPAFLYEFAFRAKDILSNGAIN
jgi:hypothetical protein